MKIGVHALPHHEIPIGEMKNLVLWLFGRGHEIYLSQPFARCFEKSGKARPEFPVFGISDDIKFLDVFLSLGGDGTILDSILFAVPNDLPVLGINYGRLGFLANSHAREYETAIQKVELGQYSIQERSLLSVQIPDEIFTESFFAFALNEISLTKRDSASMITVKTILNGDFLNDYWGDGIIVSSATGSTGYSLSCGGPILWPESKGMVLTPISPHNLSMRPLVLPENVKLELTPLGRQQKVMLSMDSRSRTFPVKQKIVITSAPQKAKFIDLSAISFAQTLREKLFWGKDFRN